MDNKGISVSIGFGWLFLSIMISLFIGTPDLHDAIIFNLVSGDLTGLDQLAIKLD